MLKLNALCGFHKLQTTAAKNKPFLHTHRQSLIVLIDWSLSGGYSRYLCNKYLHCYPLASECEIFSGKFPGTVIASGILSNSPVIEPNRTPIVRLHFCSIRYPGSLPPAVFNAPIKHKLNALNGYALPLHCPMIKFPFEVNVATAVITL